MGFRTGLFVSPHIACFRERMQVNGVLVDANEFVDVLREVFGACRELELSATEFEVAFLMAAVFFRRQSCDAVVLEVGLGGEHDATNVVRTSLSIICSVGKSGPLRRRCVLALHCSSRLTLQLSTTRGSWGLRWS